MSPSDLPSGDALLSTHQQLLEKLNQHQVDYMVVHRERGGTR